MARLNVLTATVSQVLVRLGAFISTLCLFVCGFLNIALANDNLKLSGESFFYNYEDVEVKVTIVGQHSLSVWIKSPSLSGIEGHNRSGNFYQIGRAQFVRNSKPAVTLPTPSSMKPMAVGSSVQFDSADGSALGLSTTQDVAAREGIILIQVAQPEHYPEGTLLMAIDIPQIIREKDLHTYAVVVPNKKVGAQRFIDARTVWAESTEPSHIGGVVGRAIEGMQTSLAVSIRDVLPNGEVWTHGTGLINAFTYYHIDDTPRSLGSLGEWAQFQRGSHQQVGPILVHIDGKPISTNSHTYYGMVGDFNRIETSPASESSPFTPSPTETPPSTSLRTIALRSSAAEAMGLTYGSKLQLPPSKRRAEVSLLSNSWTEAFHPAIRVASRFDVDTLSAMPTSTLERPENVERIRGVFRVSTAGQNQEIKTAVRFEQIRLIGILEERASDLSGTARDLLVEASKGRKDTVVKDRATNALERVDKVLNERNAFLAFQKKIESPTCEFLFFVSD